MHPCKSSGVIRDNDHRLYRDRLQLSRVLETTSSDKVLISTLGTSLADFDQHVIEPKLFWRYDVFHFELQSMTAEALPKR